MQQGALRVPHRAPQLVTYAGVMIGNPACGFCTGYQGVLASGERCIAATPRNFQGRMGSPEDVASVVLLASDPAAEYMTGQVIPVDGGLSAGRYGIPVADE